MLLAHRDLHLRRGLAAALAAVLALAAVIGSAGPARAAAELNWTLPGEPLVLTAGEPMASLLYGSGSVDKNLGPGALRVSQEGLPAGLRTDARSECVSVFPGAYLCMGFATMSGTPTTPGTYTVHLTMSIGSATSTKPLTIVVLPGEPSAGRSAISGSDGERVADGVDAHEVRAVVRSEAGVALRGLTHDEVLRALEIRHTGAGTLGTFVEAEAGEYVAPVVSDTAGTARITASAPGGPVDLPFVAAYSGERSALSVSPGARSADGAHAHTVTLEARDSAGAVLEGLDDASVRALSRVAAVDAQLGPFGESAPGTYEAALVSTTVGEATVTADALGSPAQAVFAEPIALTPDAVDVPYGAVDVLVDVLANDRGTDVRVTGARLDDPGAGAVTVSPDGSHLSFSTGAGFTGVAVVSYDAVDAFGLTAGTTARLTVHGRPVVLDREERTARDRRVTVDVATMLDPEATLPASVADLRAETGSATLTGSTIVYEPARGFTGTDTVTVTAVDQLGQTGSGTLTVEVVGPPVLEPYRRTVVSGTDLRITPADLGVAGLAYVSSEEHADADVTFTRDGDGSYRYATALGYTAEHVWTATYADEFGQRTTVTIVLTSEDPAVLEVSDGLRSANGAHPHTVTLELADHDGTPRTGLADDDVRTLTRVSADGGDLGELLETAPGVYEAPLVSSVPGTAVVTTRQDGRAEAAFGEAIALEPDEVTVTAGARDRVADVLANDRGTGLRIVDVVVEDSGDVDAVVGDGGAHLLVAAPAGSEGVVMLTYEAVDAFGYAETAEVRVVVEQASPEPGPEPGPGVGGGGESGTGDPGAGDEGAEGADAASVAGVDAGVLAVTGASVAVSAIMALLLIVGGVLVRRRATDPGRA